ncbi:MAG: YifB family Mg chelatase-like AAA ATPase [Candidatus Cryptobacteroides sp.]
MLTTVSGAKCVGIDAIPVRVEVNISSGIGIHLVGLADAAVKESLLRTITALQSLGYKIPGKKIVINLAPADLQKKGSGYDLPIALGIIASSGQKELPLMERFLIMGELGLDGTVRDVPGALAVMELAASLGMDGCIFPEGSAQETVNYAKVKIYGVATLDDATDILQGNDPERFEVRKGIGLSQRDMKAQKTVDFNEIIGQEAAKRGLEIAAAGGHNIILIGPPGSGKSTLAKALAAILPPMGMEESLQTSKIYSVAGKGCEITNGMRPFRAPHASASVPALIGGGSGNIVPGEISLAHNGVLFLDEFCELPKRVTEALRGPMEDRKVAVSRLRTKVEFPASFMLVAATNPCPCGFYGDGNRCVCTPSKRLSYISRLSGPMMDRIDLQVVVRRVTSSQLAAKGGEESSTQVAERVKRAREIQLQRYSEENIFTNSEMNIRQIEKFCPLSTECRSFLNRIMESMNLSLRAYHRIIRLARTIADLEGSHQISENHILEAASFRILDKDSSY